MRLCIHGAITRKEKKKTALKWKLKMRKFFNVIILSSLALYIDQSLITGHFSISNIKKEDNNKFVVPGNFQL